MISEENIKQLHLDTLSLKHATLSEATTRQIYNEYNEIKHEQTLLFLRGLDNLAMESYNELVRLIDEWVINSNRKQEDREEDSLLLASAAILLQSLDEQYINMRLPMEITSSYDRAVQYYVEKEIEKIKNTTGRVPVQNYVPKINWDDPTVKKFYSNYTIEAFRNIPKKYRTVIEGQIQQGYANNLGIEEISANIKNAINPTATDYEMDYIYQRIARTEMAFYTETAKLDGWQSIGIQNAMFMSRRDNRVCAVCIGYDGKIYNFVDIGKTVIIPVHPNCRCVWIPIYEPDDLTLLPLLLFPYNEY